MHEWQVWVVAALLLFVAEMFAPGFWLACVGAGSLVAALVSAVVPGLLGPVLAFSAVTVLSLVAVRPFLVAHMHRLEHRVRTNVDALVGKTGVVSERIEPAANRGRVIVDGEDWRSASLDETPIEPGSRVMVLRVEGATLYVEKEP